MFTGRYDDVYRRPQCFINLEGLDILCRHHGLVLERVHKVIFDFVTDTTARIHAGSDGLHQSVLSLRDKLNRSCCKNVGVVGVSDSFYDLVEETQRLVSDQERIADLGLWETNGVGDDLAPFRITTSRKPKQRRSRYANFGNRYIIPSTWYRYEEDVDIGARVQCANGTGGFVVGATGRDGGRVRVIDWDPFFTESINIPGRGRYDRTALLEADIDLVEELVTASLEIGINDAFSAADAIFVELIHGDTALLTPILRNDMQNVSIFVSGIMEHLTAPHIGVTKRG